jgi:hypothetical protein
MMVNEQVAQRSKWCPMVRICWQGGIVAFNRGNPGPKARFYNALFRTFFPRLHWLYRLKFSRCFGSSCMMWRWHNISNGDGYCGLAGSPVQ